MEALRVEADGTATENEEMKKKVKELEQKTLEQEHEIKSLTTKNGVLENEVEKLEGDKTNLKKENEDGAAHGTQNEALQRKLHVLEEEAEEADKNLRETNEKYAGPAGSNLGRTDPRTADYGKQTSRPVITSGKYKHSRARGSNGNRSTRRCRRSTPIPRGSWTNLLQRLATCEGRTTIQQIRPWNHS